MCVLGYKAGTVGAPAACRLDSGGSCKLLVRSQAVESFGKASTFRVYGLRVYILGSKGLGFKGLWFRA